MHTGRPVGGGCRIVHDHGRGINFWRGADPATLAAMHWGWWSWYDPDTDSWTKEDDGAAHPESLPDSGRVFHEAYWNPAEQGWVRWQQLPEDFREENTSR